MTKGNKPCCFTSAKLIWSGLGVFYIPLIWLNFIVSFCVHLFSIYLIFCGHFGATCQIICNFNNNKSLCTSNVLWRTSHFWGGGGGVAGRMTALFGMNCLQNLCKFTIHVCIHSRWYTVSFQNKSLSSCFFFLSLFLSFFLWSVYFSWYFCSDSGLWVKKHVQNYSCTPVVGVVWLLCCQSCFLDDEALS